MKRHADYSPHLDPRERRNDGSGEDAGGAGGAQLDRYTHVDEAGWAITNVRAYAIPPTAHLL